jgi:Uma2 family endonuclease
MAAAIPAPAPEQVATGEKISFADFLRRYDGQHAEWLVGEVNVMSNNLTHQDLLLFLVKLLGLYLDFKPVGKLLMAGFSMYIAEDVPARQPDILIVLNEHLAHITETYLDGPADIAVEIVSPESVTRDRGAKFAEYEAAGVGEYWLFDPIRQDAVIYALSASGLYARLPLDAEGRLTSALLPGFALDPALLWAEARPEGLRLLRLASAMAGVPLD